MNAQIKAAREALGQAFKEAQRLGQEAAAKPGDSATQEAFGKATADVKDKTNGLRVLEAVEEIEQQAKDFNTPAGRMSLRDPAAAGGHDRPGDGDNTPSARMALRAGRTLFKRLGLPETQEFHAAHRDAFMQAVTRGDVYAMRSLEAAGVKPAEIHALMGTQGDLGGFLVPEDFRTEVVRDLAGFAVIRAIARVIPTGSSQLVLPSIKSATVNPNIYSSGFTGSWKPEGYTTGGNAPPTQDQPKFGQERIPVHVWQPDGIELTTQLLEDSGAPLDMILAEVIAETRALDEDSAFIAGSGVNMPMGLLNAGLTAIKSGVSGGLSYGGLVDLFAGLPAQYRQNARWLMSSLTFAQVLKLADTQQRPIFTPNEIPGNLWTRPMVFSEFMPTPAADADAIIFGDFRFYGIADRQELRVQRLTERFAPNIGILPTARLGGQVLRPNAFRVHRQQV